MILRPCFRCPNRDHCTLELEKREKLKGSRITSAKFTCDIYKSLYQRGDVVEFTAYKHGWEDLVPFTCRGIVVRFAGGTDGKVTIVVPTGWDTTTDPEDGMVFFTSKNKNAKECRMVRYWPETERSYRGGSVHMGNTVKRTGERVDLAEYLCCICGKPHPKQEKVDDKKTCGDPRCRQDLIGDFPRFNWSML